jgi:hypothetical protein
MANPALKPKLGFPERIQWEGGVLDVADLRLTPLDATVPRIWASARSRPRRGAGRGRHQHIEVAPLPPDVPDETIALVSLDRFLDWSVGGEQMWSCASG